MILYPQNIAEILKAELLLHFDSSIDIVAIDSRSLQIGSGTLFFALKGANHDAHDFIPDLIAAGVINFVVKTVPHDYSGLANFYIVDDTLESFQKFAIHHRNQFNLPVIGITGSNGKTVVKEWLNFLLSPEFNIVRSPKSYNSQVGVPSSILAINDRHNLGIFEAGISTVDEMKHLARMIRPTIGILTNIRSAHDEGFADKENKIEEKFKLFRDCAVVICENNEKLVSKIRSSAEIFTWSFNDRSADVMVSTEIANEKALISFQEHGGEFTITIPFTDSASIENAISCVMLMKHLKYNESVIKARSIELFPVNMRLVDRK